MFADSFCDSDWSNRSHRGWTTLISFSLQAIAVGCLLLLPLLYSQGLPRLVSFTPLLAPAPPPALHPAQPHADSHSGAQAEHCGNRADQSGSNSLHGKHGAGDCLASADDQFKRIRHWPRNRRSSRHGCWLSFWFRLGIASFAATGSAPSAAISRMMEGNLIFRVQPDYPALARQVRVQGQVVLRAMISREGTIENLQVLSGHPMLVRAAVDAVRQWRYRPYELNGRASRSGNRS